MNKLIDHMNYHSIIFLENRFKFVGLDATKIITSSCIELRIERDHTY